MFIGAEMYYSSARILSDVLKRKNIKLKNRIFYKYILPDNQTPAKYENKIQYASMFYLYKRGDLKKWIQEGWTENMSGDDIKKIEQYIYSQKDVSRELIMNGVIVIKQQNPELSRILTRSMLAKIDLLFGAVYGFAPNDINYFISRFINAPNAMNDDNVRMEKLSDKLGCKIGYILSPETQAEIESKL